MAWWLDDPATELKFALRSDSSSSLDLARATPGTSVWVRCLAAARAPRTARGSGDSSVSSADRAPALEAGPLLGSRSALPGVSRVNLEWDSDSLVGK